MKTYDDLTKQGKKRRYRKVIELALKEYDLDIIKIEYFLEHTNQFFTLFDSNNQKYVFKIFNDLTTNIEDNLFEVFFMNLVTTKTDVHIPEVVMTKTGEGVITTKSEYTPSPIRSSIYKWVEGKYLAGKETNELFYLLGQSMAKIHKATHLVDVPMYLSPKEYNQVFYFKDEKIVYKDETYSKFLNQSDIDAMDKIIPYINSKLEKIYCLDTPQILHGDMHQWNVLVYDNKMTIIDFEDAVLGLPIHDLSITLFYYEHSKEFNFREVKEHILNGYKSIRPLSIYSDELLDLLMMARRVNFINFILQVSEEEDPTEFIQNNMKHIKDYINMHV